MFPVANRVPLRYPPIATWALIATNAIVFLFEVGLSPSELNEFLYRWIEDGPAIEASPLQSDEMCDVVVIGSGIAGLSTAYELCRFGRSVIVVDRGKIGGGMTARTTAHLATELDDFYSELIRVRGEDEARLYYDSQVAAVNRIEAICADERIDADFARVDGFLFPAEESHRADLEKEYQACRKINVDVDWTDRAPVPGINTGSALHFPNQGRFHPT